MADIPETTETLASAGLANGSRDGCGEAPTSPTGPAGAATSAGSPGYFGNNQPKSPERVVFVEEGIGGSRVRVIAAGEIDASLLDAVDAFVIRRRRPRAIEVDGEWAE